MARLLGLQREKMGAVPVLRMKYGPSLLGSTALHGGAVGALLECAARLEVLAAFPETVVPLELANITVEYLRPAHPKDTLARGTITRLGRRLAGVRVEAWQTDPSRPVACAHVSYLLV